MSAGQGLAGARPSMVPKGAADAKAGPCWYARPDGMIVLVCGVGHHRPLAASLIGPGGEVAETMPVNGRECSLRCPRLHCAISAPEIVLEGYAK